MYVEGLYVRGRAVCTWKGCMYVEGLYVRGRAVYICRKDSRMFTKPVPWPDSEDMVSCVCVCVCVYTCVYAFLWLDCLHGHVSKVEMWTEWTAHSET